MQRAAVYRKEVVANTRPRACILETYRPRAGRIVRVILLLFDRAHLGSRAGRNYGVVVRSRYVKSYYADGLARSIYARFTLVFTRIFVRPSVNNIRGFIAFVDFHCTCMRTREVYSRH